MTEFTMPSLGADMDRGTVVEWMVSPGDTVERGDIVVLVETEKGIIEVEIWEEGTIGELLVSEGTEVPVGTPLATLAGPTHEAAPSHEATPSHEAPSAPASQDAATAPVAEVAAEASATAAAPPAQGRVTPPVRHLAHELDVDLAAITGTGPNGSISRTDVRSAAHAPSAPPEPGKEPRRPKASPRARVVASELELDLAAVTGTGPGLLITEADVRATRQSPAAVAERDDPSITAPPAPGPATGSGEPDKTEERRLAMRRAIAAVMAKSKREIPHYYLGTSIDMSRALRWLTEANEQRPMAERVLPVVLLLKATALATRDVPEINGFFVDDHFEPAPSAHLGVAVSLRKGGLIAPALHDADRKDLNQIMTDLTDLVTRARTGRLRSSEMSDPTITVTNLGDRGVEVSYGVIYAPQVALVSFGKVTEKPWAENGMMAVRPVIQATLSADHRVSDGHRGGLFLEAIDHYLQEPETL